MEMQIEESGNASISRSGNVFPAGDAGELREHRDLLLQRSRILQEIASARNPRYRALLEENLAHLDSRLSQFR